VHFGQVDGYYLQELQTVINQTALLSLEKLPEADWFWKRVKGLLKKTWVGLGRVQSRSSQGGVQARVWILPVLQTICNGEDALTVRQKAGK
jgi:hypothetical protein